MFKTTKTNEKAILKPFVFGIEDGFLVGLSMPSLVGSPCPNCVGLWLEEKKVSSQRLEVSDLSVRKDILGELIIENSPHVLYEITKTGAISRLESLVFPHPECNCKKELFFPLSNWTKDLNFAFSPISEIRSIRYGTPNGSLWLSIASGKSCFSHEFVRASSVQKERELSRFSAVANWLKKAAFSEINYRISRGEILTGENFQTGFESRIDSLTKEGLGSGSSKEEALLNSLTHFALVRTLKKYANSMKNPMLVVGTNSWVRTRVPFFLLQNYDIHLLFYPNSTPCWVVGLIALSRVKTDENPIFTFSAGKDVALAFENALFKLLEICGLKETIESAERLENRIFLQKEKFVKNISQLNLWWTYWVYRCPKINMKDIIHLESYDSSIEQWKNYFKDGQESLSVIEMNDEILRKEIMWLIKVNSDTLVQTQPNIRGIGTWKYFKDALL